MNYVSFLPRISTRQGKLDSNPQAQQIIPQDHQPIEFAKHSDLSNPPDKETLAVLHRFGVELGDWGWSSVDSLAVDFHGHPRNSKLPMDPNEISGGSELM